MMAQNAELAPAIVFEFSQRAMELADEALLRDLERLAQLGYRFSLDQVASITGGQLLPGTSGDSRVEGVCLDSRQLAQGRLMADGAPAEVLTPALIERLYGYPAQVLHHPRSGLPMVI